MATVGKGNTAEKITPLQANAQRQLEAISAFNAARRAGDQAEGAATVAKKKGRGKAQTSSLQQSIDRKRRSINELYATLHPDRAARERELRKRQAAAANDYGHKRNGTVETHAKAGKVRQGALARLHLSGAISTDQFGWALEIAAEHERIDAEVTVRSASIETRVDVSRNGDSAFYESLGRVRRSVAYTRWRAALPGLLKERTGAQHLLEMVVDDLGLTWAAKRLRMSVRKTRGALVEALELWPTLLGEVKDDVGKREWLDVYAKLAA
jgi:hypothetical protein